MDFGLTAMQQDRRERAQRLLGEEFSSVLVRDAEASADGFPRRLWQAGAELGWPGLLVAEEFGGSGADLVEMCVLLEELGRAGATLPLVASSGVGVTLLAGSPAGPERDRLLRAIAAGVVVAPALIDREGRNEFDVPRLSLVADGDDFRSSGSKVLVPFGAAASELLVTAVGPSGAMVVVAVDVGAEGVTVTPHQARVGVPLASVEFDDVRLPGARLVCEGEQADRAVHAALRAGALLATAEAVGMAEALVGLTAQRVTHREAFGRPIGTFQAVAHPCADMRISVDAIRILVQEAAWLLDNGRRADEEVPATKALANELFERVANDAFRLHGALGFSNECDVQLYMRRLHGFFGSWGETHESYERAASAMGMS